MSKFIIGNSLRKKARYSPGLQKSLWMIDYLAVGGLIWLMRLLPADLASAAGRQVGRLLGPLMRQKSRKMLANLQQMFPDMTERARKRLLRQTWGNIGAIMAEYPHLETTCDPRTERLQVEVRGPVATCADHNRPAVFVTAHLSNWEMAAAAITRLGIPSVCLYTPPQNPWLDRMLLQSRRALGCRLVARDDSMRPLVKALQSGESAAMVIDRRVDAGHPIPFFGAEKPTTLLPARLAIKFHCELVPIEIVRLRGARYRAVLHPPITPRQTDASAEEQAIEMMMQVNEMFEQWIKARPAEWFCSKRVWPKAKMMSQGVASKSSTPSATG